MMERSIAIKSPSIHYHLAGTKKVSSSVSLSVIMDCSVFQVQQELAKPGQIERFLGDKVTIIN